MGKFQLGTPIRVAGSAEQEGGQGHGEDLVGHAVAPHAARLPAFFPALFPLAETD